MRHGVPAPATPRALYGVNWQGSLGLVRLDRDTLRPLDERRVRLTGDGEPLGWSFAPDRSRLVVGSTARGARLRLIDLRAMHALGDVRVADRGSGIATTWAGSRRVLAVVVTPGCCGAGDTIVAGVDTERRRVVWRRALGGSLQAGERWRHGLLLVLGPRSRSVGPSRLAWVGPRGGIRSTSLPEIRSGSAPDGSVTRSWNPGRRLTGRVPGPSSSKQMRPGRGGPADVRCSVAPTRARRAGGGRRCGSDAPRALAWPRVAGGHRLRQRLLGRRSGGAHAGRHTQLACSHNRPAHDRRCARFRHTARLVVPRPAGIWKRAHRLLARRNARDTTASRAIRSGACSRSVRTRWWEDHKGARSSKPARVGSCAATAASPRSCSRATRHFTTNAHARRAATPYSWRPAMDGGPIGNGFIAQAGARRFPLGCLAWRLRALSPAYGQPRLGSRASKEMGGAAASGPSLGSSGS